MSLAILEGQLPPASNLEARGVRLRLRCIQVSSFGDSSLEPCIGCVNPLTHARQNNEGSCTLDAFDVVRAA